MKAWIGKFLFGIGVIHSLFGFVFMRSTLAVLWSEGLFNTVNGQPGREAVFWFLYTGFLLLIMGALVDRLEKSGFGIPPFLAWSFLALTVIGAVVMPISGLWLLVPPVVGMFVRARSFNKSEST
ncbi:MAG: hypothetical protein GY856_05845 [bacterium]|nr:hypothetical protein [bacterium]